MKPALTGTTQQIYQAPSFGPARTVVVDQDWTDLLGGWDDDLVEIRVPAGSRRVLAIRSADPIAGTTATAEQELVSRILDPGIHVYSTNRGPADPRVFLAIDSTDAGMDVLATARVKIAVAS